METNPDKSRGINQPSRVPDNLNNKDDHLETKVTPFTSKKNDSSSVSSTDVSAMRITAIEKNTQPSTANVNYNTTFIETDTALYKFIDELNTEYKDSTIHYISNRNDLSENNLTDKNIVIYNSDGTTKLQRGVGNLYSNNTKPEVLVLDFNHIPISEFASFNSIFDDNPPTLNGKPLGTNIHINCIVSKALFNLPKDKGPGNDFWRRVFKTSNEIIYQEQKETDITCNKNIQEILAPEVNEIVNDENSLVIELAGKNWRNELFGHLAIDEHSNVFYQPGKLAQLQENQNVYLKDAPWMDIDFNVAIQQLNTRRSYLSNGEVQKIAENINLHSYSTTEQEIKSLQNEFKWSLSEIPDDLLTPGKIRTINDVSLYSCMQEANIKDGKLVKYDTMRQLIDNDVAAIRVTNKLNSSQWFNLLTKLKAIGKTDILILQDNPELQPNGWQSKEKFNLKTPVNKNVEIVLNNRGFIPDISDKNKPNANKFIDVQVSPDTSLMQLLHNFKSLSMDTNIFEIADNLILQAFKEGWEINLYGLEHNPKLLKELETLFCNPPYLIIQGVVVILYNLNVKIHVSNNSIMPTYVLKQAKDNAHEAIKDSIPIIKEKIHANFATKINKNLSNQMIGRITKLVEKINAIPKSVKAPKDDLIADTPLFNKVWQQALAEQAHDGCDTLTEWHFTKSFNSIVNKRYREDSETYYLARMLTNIIINPEHKSRQDLIGLENWIGEQQEVTQHLIEENINLLSKFIPYSPLLKQNEANSIVSGLKKLASAAFSLLKFVFITVVVSTIKIICNLIYNCFVLLSKIIPFMKTRSYTSLLKTKLPTDKSNLKRQILADKKIMISIKASIVACITDKDKQQKVQKNLGITDTELQQQIKLYEDTYAYEENYYKLEKFMRDICYSIPIETLDKKTQQKIKTSGYQQLCHDLSLNLTNKILAFKQNKDNNQEKIKKDLLTEIIQTIKVIMPEASKEVIKEREEIAEELFNFAIYGSPQTIWKFWLERRDNREQTKSNTHPVTIIKGPPGTGKSEIARKIAKRNNLDEDPIFFNVKANSTTEDVSYKFDIDYTAEEKELKLIEGPLLQWANRKRKGIHTLILDEATLTNELWDCIKGMYDYPRYITVHGRKLELTTDHCLIMTSNSDYTAGRNPNFSLQRFAAEQMYLPFANSFKEQQIVKKEVVSLLDGIKFSDNFTIKNDVANQVTKCITDLYHQYEKYIPGHVFTPRDLTDCCSRIEAYFCDYITGKNQDKLSVDMLYAVTREAMKETIANGVEIKYSGRIKAIDVWHQVRFPGNDKVVNENNKKFKQFYDEMKTYLLQQGTAEYKKFDLENKSTEKLTKIVWQELQRIQLEHDIDKIHTGRHVIVIESPAGMGKDAVIALVTRFWESKGNPSLKHDAITAGIKSTDKIVTLIEQKFKQGGLISISEINTYDTQSIEGYLNHFFSEKPHEKGFSVFLTNNPTEGYASRHEFSPALKSRVTPNILHGHSFEDLHSICKSQLTTKKHAYLIVKYHWNLTTIIQNADKTAYPSIADIQNLAEIINDLEATKIDITDTVLKELIKDNYKKYTRLLGWNDKNIAIFAERFIINDNSRINKYYIEDLTIWINQQSDLNLNPITIVSGIMTYFNTATGILSLSVADQQKNEEQKQQLILQQISGISRTIESQQISEDVVERIKDDANISNRVKEERKKELGSQFSITTKFMLKRFESRYKDIIKLSSCTTDFLTDTPKQFDYSPVQSDMLSRKKLSVLNDRRSLLSLLTNEGIPSEYPGINYLLPIRGVNFECEKIPLQTRIKLVSQIKQELCNEDIASQLKISLTQSDCSENNFNKFLLLIENDSIKTKLENSNNRELIRKGFKIIEKINCSATDTLICLSLTPFQYLDASEIFATTLAKGNIQYQAAIQMIKNYNPLAILYEVKVLIIANICKNLLEEKVTGDQVNNLIEIMKYLIKESNGHYFNTEIINNLEILSKKDGNLQHVADVAKELLEHQYSLFATKEIRFSEVKPKEAPDVLDTIPVKVKELLSNIAEKSVTNLIMQDKTTALELKATPGGQGINIPNFLAGKPAFEYVKTVDDVSKNVAIVGTPIITSLEFSGLLYHEPTNQIIDLLDIMLDFEQNYKVEFVGVIREKVEKHSERKVREYLAKKNIIIVQDDNFEEFDALLEIIVNLSALLRPLLGIPDFLTLQPIKKTPRYMATAIEHLFAENEEYKQFTKKANDLLKGSSFTYIPIEAIAKISFRKMLAHTKKLTFCCSFNHSSCTGSATVKNETDLTMLEAQTTSLIEHTPFLKQPQYEHFKTSEQLKLFEKKAIKEQLIDATVIHTDDIMQEFRKHVIES